jgi:hypothetical protein
VSLDSSIQPASFIAAVAREVKEHYAAEGREPHGHARSRLAQFWWGPVAAIHYEIAVHDRAFQLELGLHFEASPTTNRQLLQALNPHLLEIQEALGDSIWLEDWDRGWTRIYETQPLYPLDDTRVMAVAMRLVEIMDYLQPLLDAIQRNEVK